MRLYPFYLTFLLFLFHLALSGQAESFIIVVDPGHGGKDPGCSNQNHLEKDIALNLSLQIQKTLKEKYPEVDILLTRSNDTFIPLHERIGFANEIEADLFISIHCNTYHLGGVQGSETYVLGLEESSLQSDITKRENSVIQYENNVKDHYAKYDLDSPEAWIIMNAYKQNHLEQSIRFANHLQQSIEKNTQLLNRGVKQAGFVVLKMANMPAVLFEAGFISEAEDTKYLSSKEGQLKLAEAFNNAMENLLDEQRSFEVKKVDQLLSGTLGHYITEDQEAYNDWLIAEQYQIRIQLISSLQEPLEKKHPIWQDVPGIQEVISHPIYNYTTSNYVTLQSAQKALHHYHSNGYPGAYIVAMKGEERIIIK